MPCALVVDDEPGIVGIRREFLTAKGYAALVGADVPEALQAEHPT